MSIILVAFENYLLALQKNQWANYQAKEKAGDLQSHEHLYGEVLQGTNPSWNQYSLSLDTCAQMECAVTQTLYLR